MPGMGYYGGFYAAAEVVYTSSSTPIVGTYKFTLIPPNTVVTIVATKNERGQSLVATLTSSVGYGTNDPNEAFILNTLYPKVVEQVS